jgi:hypothetical protein
MRFRKLRIEWSVAWGVLVVLLIAMWVRSYQASDVFPLRPFCISTYGRLVIWLREEPVPFGGSGLRQIDLSSESLLRVSRIIDIEPFEVEPFSSRTGFYLEHDDRRSIVQLPYWFLTLLFVAIASLPWLRWHFSLRTLLIATTLVAVLMGTVIWAVR